MAAYGTEGKKPSATAQKMERAGYVNIQKADPTMPVPTTSRGACYTPTYAKPICTPRRQPPW